MSDKINIAGLDKAEVLAALYNASRPLGMGFLRATPGDMSTEEARQHVGAGDDHAKDFPIVAAERNGRLYFDYLNGRVMKVDLSDDEFDPWLYDRDNGEGAAAKALDSLLVLNAAEIG